MSEIVSTKYSERGPLGQLVVNIEFIIISIVQGAAVTTLAAQTANLISTGSYEYLPYVITGFIFAMFFWSEAISHTLSFIDWPLHLPHTFLYFLVGFLEMVAFLQLTNPLVWFTVFFLLTVVGILLYVVDYQIIKQQKDQIAVNEAGTTFYKGLIKDHQLGLYVLTPLALIFNLVAIILIILYPELFLQMSWHVILVSLQGLITAVVLGRSVMMFQSRVEILADLYGTTADKLQK